MEKAFHTTDPLEADSLEEELEHLSIDVHIEEDPGDSGLTGFTFYVSSEYLEITLQRARVVRARTISGQSDIEEYSAASEILRIDRQAKSEKIKDLSGPALPQIFWRFRRTLAIACLPVMIPIAKWLRNNFQFSYNVRLDAAIAYFIGFSTVLLLIGLLYYLLRPNTEE